MEKGNVFNIQRFTLHDGPGIRTELFLKGCPLRCHWCSNPESWLKHTEPGIYTSKCISVEKCGACRDVCPTGAVRITDGIVTSIDRTLCTSCMKCAEECPADAIKAWGNVMTVEECMEIIEKDRGYYEKSGGGVTVSGGDPMVQSDFVLELFKACKDAGISTCIESTFYAPWKDIEKLLPYTDLIITDIKHMNSEVHKENTGVHNELILENLKKLADLKRKMIVRIPVIPGFNDTQENIEETADYITNSLNGCVRTLQLLSFMRLGQEKYQSLGLPYLMENVEINREEFQEKIHGFADYFNSRGIHCIVGTKEKN